MSPRTGRPTDNPKTEQIKIRATKEDRAVLERCCVLLNKTQYEIIMECVRKLYADVAEERN